MAIQTVVVLPEMASPQVIGMLKQAAQRGEILYECADSDELEEIEISPECDDAYHDECDDGDCECPCHEEDDGEGVEDDEEETDELEPGDEEEISDDEDDIDGDSEEDE